MCTVTALMNLLSVCLSPSTVHQVTGTDPAEQNGTTATLTSVPMADPLGTSKHS